MEEKTSSICLSLSDIFALTFDLWFICLATDFWISFLLCVAPWCFIVCIYHIVFMLLSISSVSWLLWIELQWAGECWYPLIDRFHSLYINSRKRKKKRGHMVNLILVFWVFLILLHNDPTSSYSQQCFFTSLPAFVVFCLLLITCLSGVKWCFVVELICVSLERLVVGSIPGRVWWPSVSSAIQTLCPLRN